MMCEASVIVPCYNDEAYIKDCIYSILQQGCDSFELIVVNDGSTDRSLEFIKSIDDKRLVLINSPAQSGPARARNLAIARARGEYLFFTDSDCVVAKDWLKTGLEALRNSDCLGVEGKTFYISENYKPAYSDRLPGNVEKDGQFMACNVVYKKEVVQKVAGFNPEFSRYEDRELALKVLRFGKIASCNRMIVIHRQKKWRIKTFMSSAKYIRYRIKLFKYHGDRFGVRWRILNPLDLIKIVVPPLAFLKPMMSGKIKTWSDFRLTPFFYFHLLYQRLIIWKTALKERVIIL